MLNRANLADLLVTVYREGQFVHWWQQGAGQVILS